MRAHLFFKVLIDLITTVLLSLGWDIGILPAYTRYRLVGKVHPPLVSNVEQVARAGQLHLTLSDPGIGILVITRGGALSAHSYLLAFQGFLYNP